MITAITAHVLCAGLALAMQPPPAAEPQPIPAATPPSGPASNSGPASPAGPASPPPVALPGPSAMDASSAEFLDALEKAESDLRTLKADVQYIKTFSELEGGGRHIRRGSIAYAARMNATSSDQPARRGFVVDMRQLIVDDKLREERQQYIFDGTFLVERYEQEKRFIRRRAVAEGSARDPMRIGEGPFPLPLGQRRADMVARFEVSEVATNDGVPEGPAFDGLRKLLTGTRQLRLVPRAGTDQARDFRDIRLWYRTSDLLPIFAMTSNVDDTRAEVLLTNIQRNPEIPASTFSVEPPDAAAGWDVQIVRE